MTRHEQEELEEFVTEKANLLHHDHVDRLHREQLLQDQLLQDRSVSCLLLNLEGHIW